MTTYRRSMPIRVLQLLACLTVLATVEAGTAAYGAGDAPLSFFYGSDSNAPTAAGSGYPYTARGTGGVYGSYVGEVGTWTNWQGCTSGEALNRTALHQANTDEAYRGAGGSIPGVFFYWFAAGPGADPHYNATVAEAYHWGTEQAEAANADYARLAAEGLSTDTRYIPLMFLDVEGQPVAGYANGWNEEVNRCAQITGEKVIPTAVDRATFNGFYDYMAGRTIFHPGIYSTASYWDYTFGTGSEGAIPKTYEWTPVDSTGRVTPDPRGFCQAGLCAKWFGGILSSRRAGWQWNQNGGDYDQWSTADLP